MAHTGEGINVMTQALCTEDGVIMRNSMVYPQTLRKKTPVARSVVAMQVPEPPIQTGLMEALDETQGLQTPKLTVKQRQEKLFKELDLSGLESWPCKLSDSAWSLLAEYHDIFLEPSELGFTHSTEHVIKVTNNTPFKEQFRQIPLPLMEEVHTHLQVMLDSGMIHPIQSAWCNVVVLVWKKSRGLHFCIDFSHLNAHTKNTPTHCQDIGESGRCW